MDLADLQLLESHAPAALLHVVRATAFLAALPILGQHLPSRMLRLVLGVALGGAAFCLAGMPLVQVGHGLDLVILALREALVGVVAGFAIHGVMAIVSVAGEVLGHEMGLTMARVLDPSTGRQDASMTRVFEVLAFLLMLEFDLHHDLAKVYLATHEHVAVGASFDVGSAVGMLQGLLAASLVLGIKLAGPVLGVLILTTGVLVVLARAVPNINLLEFSFGFRILMALGAITFFLRFATPYLLAALREGIGRAGEVFAGS